MNHRPFEGGHQPRIHDLREPEEPQTKTSELPPVQPVQQAEHEQTILQGKEVREVRSSSFEPTSQPVPTVPTETVTSTAVTAQAQSEPSPTSIPDALHVAEVNGDFSALESLINRPSTEGK